jgi:hypothetical protein
MVVYTSFVIRREEVVDSVALETNLGTYMKCPRGGCPLSGGGLAYQSIGGFSQGQYLIAISLRDCRIEDMLYISFGVGRWLGGWDECLHV